MSGGGGKYTGAVGRFHLWKESVKERWAEVSIVEKDWGSLSRGVILLRGEKPYLRKFTFRIRKYLFLSFQFPLVNLFTAGTGFEHSRQILDLSLG